MKLFDTHCHPNAWQFIGKEAEVIQRAKDNDVAYLGVVGFDDETIQRALPIADAFDNVVLSLGCHPTEASKFGPESLELLLTSLKHPKARMVGEIGLDYHWDSATREDMDRVFRQQIDIAKSMHLPITIHNRDATADVYRTLKEEGLPKEGVVMHTFGEEPYWAEKFIELGCYLSFSGVVTFKKTDQVRASAALVPDDRLLIETDSPYLTPVPYRGKINEPAHVKFVAEKLAEVRGTTLEEIARITTENACRVFNWYFDDVQ